MPRRTPEIAGQEALFPSADLVVGDALTFKPLTGHVWTANKAKLIARYLREFVFVTKHGTYVDLFAGPQAEDPQGSWAAEQVLAMQPKMFKLRQYYLFEKDTAKVTQLRGLRAEDPKVRITVTEGDSNATVRGVLPKGSISETTATFCLVDQRTTQCAWETLEYVAAVKTGGLKPEIFYFLAQKWLNRTLKTRRRTDSLAEVERWWGRDDWRELLDMRHLDRARLLADRLREELGYTYATPWPIYQRQSSGAVMFYMIHATDHPRAPALMRRAYEWAVSPIAESDDESQLALELGDL